MSQSNVDTREEIFSKLISNLQKKYTAKQAKLIGEFIQLFYLQVPLDDLLEHEIMDLYGAALSYWGFMQNRAAGETKIRVYNPQYEQHGWQSTHTIVELSIDDMPFLVDSLRMEINRQGISTHLMVNFGGLKLMRDANRHVVEILPRDTTNTDAITEAVIHIEIDRQSDNAILEALQKNLEHVIDDVRFAVKDWAAMRQRVEDVLKDVENNPPPVNEAELSETKDFLRWIKDDHFTFLGCRDYTLSHQQNRLVLSLVPGSGLGVLTDEEHSKIIRPLTSLPPEAQKLVLSKDRILILAKTNTQATIHRAVYTDYIGVKQFSPEGEIIGERRFIGLYTSAAYNSNPKHIPFLRHKVAQIINRSGFPPNGHAGKELLNVLETMPRDDLFQASVDELFEISMGIVQLQERRKIRLFARKDVYGRFISCLVFVPRDRFNSELRIAMQNILQKSFNALEISFNTYFSESILARIHFFIRINPQRHVTFDVKEIEAKLVEVSRTWNDDLHDNLVENYGEEKGIILFNKYTDAFPAGYRADFLPRSAVYDIAHIEQLSSENDLGMSFYKPIDEAGEMLRFKLFRAVQTIPLSDVLPILENMGLRMIGERPYELNFDHENAVWINDFGMVYTLNNQLNVEEVKDIFQEAFASIWFGLTENDGFNRLVLGAKLTHRETSILRAYAKYMRQTGFMFSQVYIEEALWHNPDIAKKLVNIFKLKFDPDQSEDAIKEIAQIEESVQHDLENVTSLDEDRIIRRYLQLIHATLRTNYFQLDDNGKAKTYISLKLNSMAIPELPLPKPLYEIFVYSRRFEGVHLRSSKVARGGIRWSDRREDFRTEILGLMKAQKVKNAVIVPSGAKGGFFPKCITPDMTREEVMTEGIDCYKIFISGLLDISDNLNQGKIVKPENTICFDDDDPYLVVAADKGTATFSDIANSISLEYKFWLGDAFASGGSSGYDHKKMGITARGAWESVKRNFRELNMDVQIADFTVVGIGDMSGDVFGNGMLRSKHIKLVAAFDHRDIFLDPNPDPAISFAERERLFNLPRSSWQDYNKELITKGGGVYKRTEKSIPLSPEVKIALGIEDFPDAKIVPNDLIRMILKANVDLLWNGGIGTYIKASYETHADVGDRANDFIRVNGNELRCKVIGEGGNLGCTQLSRIEYSLNGGLCFTDFIDNSAGVDCSDHEVNIKILLNGIVDSGDMTEKQRNTLLAKMTDEVGNLVLQDNYNQTIAISVATLHANRHTELYRRYLNEQERKNLIDRELEFLPSDKTLLDRKTHGVGLTRPEIAVLLAYSKINLKAEILQTDLPEDPYLGKMLENEFPAILNQDYPEQMRKHSLRREIIATQISNSLVNEMGVSFIHRLQDETGATVGEIVTSHAVASRIFGTAELQKLIANLHHQIPAVKQNEMLLQVKRLIRRTARWLIRNRRLELGIEKTLQNFAPSAEKLAAIIPDIMSGGTKEYLDALTAEFVLSGLPESLARRIAASRAMYAALNIIDVSIQYNFDVVETAKIYFEIGSRLDLVWFRDQLNISSMEEYWDSLARAALRDDLDIEQKSLTVSIMHFESSATDYNEKINQWMEQHQPLIARWEKIVASLRSSASLDFIMFFVAVRELSDLTRVSLYTAQVQKEAAKKKIKKIVKEDQSTKGKDQS